MVHRVWCSTIPNQGGSHGCHRRRYTMGADRWIRPPPPNAVVGEIYPLPPPAAVDNNDNVDTMTTTTLALTTGIPTDGECPVGRSKSSIIKKERKTHTHKQRPNKNEYLDIKMLHPKLSFCCFSDNCKGAGETLEAAGMLARCWKQGKLDEKVDGKEDAKRRCLDRKGRCKTKAGCKAEQAARQGRWQGKASGEAGEVARQGREKGSEWSRADGDGSRRQRKGRIDDIEGDRRERKSDRKGSKRKTTPLSQIGGRGGNRRQGGRSEETGSRKGRRRQRRRRPKGGTGSRELGKAR
ncbi:hypothetical protein ACLOJK_026071 [Asimina triloba]